MQYKGVLLIIAGVAVLCALSRGSACAEVASQPPSGRSGTAQSQKESFQDSFVQLGDKGGETIIVKEPGSPLSPGYLEPSIVDDAFDRHVGQRIAAVTRDARLGVSKIPGYDDALDVVGKYSPLAFELGFTLTSKYIWRGQNLGDRACWQPYVKTSTKFLPLGTFSFTYWANLLKNGNEEGEDDSPDTEHDFYFDYNFDMLAGAKLLGVEAGQWPYLLRKAADFNLAIGIWRYWFPPTGTSDNEFYGTVTYNWPLNPYVTIVNDFTAGTGIWYEVGVAQSFDLKLVTVAGYSKLGYNHKQWSASSKLQTFEFGFSLPIPVGAHMCIEPFLSYSKRLKKTYFYTQYEEATGFDGDGNEVTTTFDQGNILTGDEFYGGFKYMINF